MKLACTYPADDSWAEITAERVDFDAVPPVERLRLDWPIGQPGPDRIAVAGVLAFSPWIAGRCDLPTPFSALTEQRIVEWFQAQKIWVAPGPVRAGGLPLPRGARRLHLGGQRTGDDSVALTLVDPLEGSGGAPAEIRIATNAGVLMANAPSAASALEIRLGVAVLVADTLSINEIVDPELAGAAPESFARAQRLLECVALGLRDA